MADLLRIDLDGGKYTLIQEASGKTLLHRYGEPWLEDLHGSKVFLSMGYELEELRKLKEVVKEWAAERRTFLSGETPQLREISERMVALIGETIA